ncbi:WhiB family transcriptional regulator [Streptomyces sp. NPDC093094]|uniref:WhiB family transcriptional regulator n=1 Tax=Streptomyces sp. NPDC093094 TaxID=3366026 RepID=UPI00380D827A
MSAPAVGTRGREWERSAACLHQDAELWFADRTRDRAIAACQACPVLQPCREAVLKREEGLAKCQRSGIIAGLTGAQRYALERAGRQQPRPPGAEAAPDMVPRAGGRPRGEPAPCGTRAAYQRHLRRDEPVDDACRAANARGAGRYRRTGSTRGKPKGPGPPDRPPTRAHGSTPTDSNTAWEPCMPVLPEDSPPGASASGRPRPRARPGLGAGVLAVRRLLIRPAARLREAASRRRLESELAVSRGEVTRWKLHADSYAQEFGRISRERAHLLAWLAALHPASAVLTPAGGTEHHGTHRLRLTAGGLQMSWLVPSADLALFEHVPYAEPVPGRRIRHADESTADQDAHIRRHTHLLALEGHLLGAHPADRPPGT